MDNCVCDSNASQQDSDLDGYGDSCDPDFDNDGLVSSLDEDVVYGWCTAASGPMLGASML